jgi:anti-sigma-K factor RskA
MPEGDQVYELWLLIDDADPAPVKIFRPDADGTVGVVMDDMTPPEGAGFAITIEPAGGTDAPTGPVVATSATV